MESAIKINIFMADDLRLNGFWEDRFMNIIEWFFNGKQSKYI
jgi:hypothetical protein